MRICHVLEAAAGGSANAVEQLIGQQIKQGHIVTLIYSADRADVSIMSKLEAYKELRMATVPMKRAVGAHDVVAFLRLFICLLRLGPFDVIHSHSSKAGALARAVGLFLSAKQVYTPHAFYSMTRGAKSIYGRIESWLSHISDAIIVLSSVEEKHARDELGINPKKLYLIPNGITIDYPATRASARKMLGYAEGDKLIGFIGRFAPQKNVPRLIVAFSEVARKNPELQLALVGDVEGRLDVESALDQYKVSDKTRIFHGYKGRDVVPAFDVLVCASNYEGFALVFLEALAAGVPIVTTPVGGAHETVINGKTGFMSMDFTAPSLADALRKFMALTPDEQQVMRSHAVNHARNFTLEIMADRVQLAYNACKRKN